MSEIRGVALVFPGQGSQSKGMGRDLYERSAAARAVFEEADGALGWSVSSACFDGPDDRLRDTAISQPAILTASIAALAALRERIDRERAEIEPVCVAGHSLGQFSALVAAGVLDFADAVRLVSVRGRLMKEAGSRKPGGMLAIIGLEEAAIEDICRQVSEGCMVCAANYNFPGQTVVSGDTPGLSAAAKMATAAGARSVVPLAVTVANHSPLMEPASVAFAEVLARLPLREPAVPLIANGTARAASSAGEILDELLTHMLSPVRWHQSVGVAVERGAKVFLEVGPGQVLTGLIKRATKEARSHPVGTVEAIEKLPLLAGLA